MPPWAALEWERTGWTLLMIPTDTPSSAAARAARWPASPAPITRTSWDGTGADAIAPNSDCVVGIRHFAIRHVVGEAGGAHLQTHLAYGSMLSVWRRAPPASPLGPLVSSLWWLQPVLAELASSPVREVYCSLDGGEVDVLGDVVGPVVAAW